MLYIYISGNYGFKQLSSILTLTHNQCGFNVSEEMALTALTQTKIGMQPTRQLRQRHKSGDPGKGRDHFQNIDATRPKPRIWHLHFVAMGVSIHLEGTSNW